MTCHGAKYRINNSTLRDHLRPSKKRTTLALTYTLFFYLYISDQTKNQELAKIKYARKKKSRTGENKVRAKRYKIS